MENLKWIEESGQINPSLIDVLVSRVDANRLKLCINHKGENVRDNVRFWVTPFLNDGEAYKVISSYGKITLEDFKLSN